MMPLPASKNHYTFADCLTWGENERIEIINGEAVMMAPPTRIHQEISGELFRHFGYHFYISPELHDVRYKATLREESLTEFLQLLKSITPQMRYEVDTVNKTVTLTALKTSAS